MSPEEGVPAPDFVAGIARMRNALGDEPADAVLRARDRAVTRGDAARVEVPVSTTRDWLLDRPGLSPRERVIAILAVDGARGTTTALRGHLRLARDAGLAPSDVRELLVQLGPYPGYPTVNQVMGTVDEELTAARRGPALPLAPASRARLSLVVEDAQDVAALLGELVGIERWSVADMASGNRTATRRELTRSGLVAIGSSPTGLRIELIAPSTGNSSEHLDLLVCGTTTHHVGLAEAPVDELESWLPQLADQGDALTLTRWDDALLVVLDTRNRLGYRLAVAGADFDAVDRARPTIEEWETPPPDGRPLLPPVRTNISGHRAEPRTGRPSTTAVPRPPPLPRGHQQGLSAWAPLAEADTAIALTVRHHDHRTCPLRKDLHDPVRLVIDLTTTDEAAGDAFAAAGHDRLAGVQTEPGCLQYELFRNASRPENFTILESWADRAAFDAHLALEMSLNGAARAISVIPRHATTDATAPRSTGAAGLG